MSNQVEHSDFLCLLLIIYFIIRISFFNYLAKILLGQPLITFIWLMESIASYHQNRRLGDSRHVFPVS